MKLWAAFPVRRNQVVLSAYGTFTYAENIVAFSDGKVGLSVSSVEERKGKNPWKTSFS